MRILALDLGSSSSKTAVCILDTLSGEQRRTRIDTQASALTALLRTERPDRVVMEATNVTGWVVDLCRAHGVGEIQVVNPMDEAYRNRTSKTDPKDADLLAKLSVSGQARLVHVPERPVREWRCLIEYRHRLVRDRTRLKNRIRRLLRQEGLAGGKLWTREGMAYLTSQSKPLETCGEQELWRGMLGLELERLRETDLHLQAVESRLDRMAASSAPVRELTALAGIGNRTAEAVVATLDDPLRFRNQKDVGAYFGLVPSVHQSGKHLHHGRITKAGNRIVRALLVEIVHLATRQSDHWITAIYRRLLRDDPSRRKRAIVATARRVIVILWAKLRDLRRTSPHPPLTPAAA